MTSEADAQPPVRLPNGFSPFRGVLTAGQPSASQITQLAQFGTKTVIDLRLPDEPRGFDEPAAVRAAGMTYHNIPVAPGTLGDREFDELRALLGDESARPLLVHCGSANRVGALLIPHMVLDEKRSLDDALELAHQVGLRSNDLTSAARIYVAARDSSPTL